MHSADPSRIVFRALQGIGGSGLYSLAQVVLFEVGPSHRPSLLGAMIGITLAVSFVLGPVLGGLISLKVTWRWVFWIKYVLLHPSSSLF
jgi:MFS family permease